MTNKTIAIAGLGWLGQPLAYRLATLGYTVKGSVTTVAKAALLQQNGFDAYPVEISENGIEGEVLALLKNVDYLLIMIPPGLRKNTGADYVLKMVHLLSAINESAVKKIVLVSSTSVYDDSQGRVTERDEPKPETIAGKQLRQVEELFMNAEGLQTTVVRFGGLIGGSRNPVKYLAGRKDLADGNAPVNLIHRDDCINILVEILKNDAFGTVFNAVNPNHPKKAEYYIQKAKELGLEAPTFAEAVSNETFKQVDSVNLKSVLDYSFRTSI
ncbi:MAG: NAD(P)-dependent oxidoreductase [Aequorivita sp.]|nr:NAD(P)-dependent oxidoreductase [Aequorivita sp.]MBF30133.1 NAD(P)-dependent oxidoreductase [Aequorivita sp.]MDX1782696.1 NAD(P)H-binding protein [Aequorivita vladivostokensis]|tara:strand:+ start:336139 stop:336948 length:810 start_codon:yes stop_codon:yes gene_type:complete